MINSSLGTNRIEGSGFILASLAQFNQSSSQVNIMRTVVLFVGFFWTVLALLSIEGKLSALLEIEKELHIIAMTCKP